MLIKPSHFHARERERERGSHLAFSQGSGEWGEASLNPYQMGQNLCEYQLPANYRIVEQLKNNDVQNQIISAGLYSFLLKYTCFSTPPAEWLTHKCHYFILFFFYFKGGKSSSRRGPSEGQRVRSEKEGDDCGFPVVFVGTYMNFRLYSAIQYLKILVLFRDLFHGGGK